MLQEVIGGRHQSKWWRGVIISAVLGMAGLRAGVAASPAPAAGPAKSLITEIELADLEGGKVKPVADDGRKATVLFFLMHECPVANTYAPEISRLQAEYAAKGVRSYVVYVEEDLAVEKARGHAREYGFKLGTLRDPGHRLVRATGATVSPEAVVLSPSGKILYIGRIDDRVADFGKRRVEPTRRDLRLALDAVLAGKKVEVSRTRAVGCYIPDPAPGRERRP